MQSFSVGQLKKVPQGVDQNLIPNICLYALLYAAVTLIAYLLPTGEFLLKPGAAVLLFAGAALGPYVGFGAGLLGGIITDLAQNMLWLHWDIGLGIMGAIFGLFKYWRGSFQGEGLIPSDWLKLVVLAFAGSFIGMYFAGLVDLFLGAPALIAFYAWALPAAVMNAVFAAVVGSLIIYSVERIKNYGKSRKKRRI